MGDEAMRDTAAPSWRNRGVTKLALLGGIVMAMVGFGQSPAHAALLDANCPGPFDDGTTLNANQRLAQTFTAAHTGTVVRAEVALNKLAPGGDFTMQILDTSGGIPVNGVLGSATVPDSSVADGPTTLSGTFSSPASVAAGHLYALVISRPNDWFLTDRHGNPCPGEEIFSPDQTSPFQTPMGPVDYDFVYSVFVNPPNTFTVGKQKGKKLTLTLPGPGSVTVAKKGLLKPSTATVGGAGALTLKLKLTKKANRKLNRAGKLNVKAAITFAPTGGEPGTQTKKLKFKHKH
jgi:hypothetical protein